MQPTTSAQALQQLESAQSSAQNPADILSSQEQSLGVPQAQQQVSGLRQAITNTTNLLNQVAPSVYGRTANSLVTTAQAGRQIANEQAPISTNLNKEQTDYSGASSDLTNLLSQASTRAGLQETGQENKIANLKDIYNALYGQESDAAKMAEQKYEANLSASTSRANNAANNATNTTVNPPQEFLNYIANQYKAVGGAGAYKASRQTQDAWANAWFAQNKVPVASRQAYWDLFNQTYNRPNDPTKDWLYAK
jgi:hypothetical protein